jgi:hypothetical protein
VNGPEFFKKLLYPMRARDPGPELPWSFVGTCAYLRANHGVFKLEPWSGGVCGQVAGLQGTYTSHAGAKDHIVFEFEGLLIPDREVLKNPSLADTHGQQLDLGPRRVVADLPERRRRDILLAVADKRWTSREHCSKPPGRNVVHERGDASYEPVLRDPADRSIGF